ncbi:DUF7620 family protein [Glutamicibacter sp.]|jgi:hypothetical protein|uniref:DUF7620 family protein n=1 Tax=Glutamicibacter sp. TaxID=1931995 RepID=UPI002B475F23|nr:hypothetical protein [Glutamicibacter sp.]HJX77263.1 hypothetical protein [Glutamicibacter sp.]
MIWGRRKQAQEAADEALAAKIEAELDLKEAKQTQREVTVQSDRIREINRQNHFSEGLQRSFRGRPV